MSEAEELATALWDTVEPEEDQRLRTARTVRVYEEIGRLGLYPYQQNIIARFLTWLRCRK